MSLFRRTKPEPVVFNDEEVNRITSALQREALSRLLTRAQESIDELTFLNYLDELRLRVENLGWKVEGSDEQLSDLVAMEPLFIAVVEEAKAVIAKRHLTNGD